MLCYVDMMICAILYALSCVADIVKSSIRAAIQIKKNNIINEQLKVPLLVLVVYALSLSLCKVLKNYW